MFVQCTFANVTVYFLRAILCKTFIVLHCVGVFFSPFELCFYKHIMLGIYRVHGVIGLVSCLKGGYIHCDLEPVFFDLVV
jgi:hypothetical protein